MIPSTELLTNLRIGSVKKFPGQIHTDMTGIHDGFLPGFSLEIRAGQSIEICHSLFDLVQSQFLLSIHDWFIDQNGFGKRRIDDLGIFESEPSRFLTSLEKVLAR